MAELGQRSWSWGKGRLKGPNRGFRSSGHAQKGAQKGDWEVFGQTDMFLFSIVHILGSRIVDINGLVIWCREECLVKIRRNFSNTVREG